MAGAGARTQTLEGRYRERFRALLARVQPRRLEFGVELLIERARARRDTAGVPLPQALSELYDATRERVDKRVAATGACAVDGRGRPPAATADPPRFVCDASLGGLARWLRAAGHEAVRVAGGGDLALAEARRSGGVLLTSDPRVLERRVLADGSVPALHVPVGRTPVEQLGLVMRSRGLRRLSPRCMSCGGALRAVDKQKVRERIPPRTARWRDEYFLCAGCGRLFWQGTHWQHIAEQLALV
jgi:uncharacterized protein with PIN domain